MCMAGAALIGGAVQAFGSIAAGNQKSAELKRQAKISDRQAAIELDAGAHRQSQQRRQQDRLIGRQIASSASNGISSNSGSFIAAIDDSLTESELDIAATNYDANLKSQNEKIQASEYRSGAKNAKRAGFIGALSPLIKLGGSFA